MFIRRLHLLLALLLVGVASLAKSPSTEAYSPIYYNNTNYNGANIHYIKVDLNDSNSVVVPQGAHNRLPYIDNSWWEPRWDDLANHQQDLKAMYDGVPNSDKVALINTDYFCRSGCTGNSGAPQGLFVKNGTMYHYPPSTTPRAALTFSSSNYASINAYKGWFNAPAQGIFNAVSGGPIVLRNGTVGCNPEGSDLGWKCSQTNYRTAACISSDGRILWLLATSNQTSANNLANFMKNNLGCWNGMEFDGGSSTGMVYKGVYKVSPAVVGTGLLIRYLGSPQVAPSPDSAVDGGSVKH